MNGNAAMANDNQDNFKFSFSSAFTKKQGDVIMSCENNGVLSSLLNEERIKQYLLRIIIVAWVQELDNMYPTNKQELAVREFFPVLVILG